MSSQAGNVQYITLSDVLRCKEFATYLELMGDTQFQAIWDWYDAANNATSNRDFPLFLRQMDDHLCVVNFMPIGAEAKREMKRYIRTYLGISLEGHAKTNSGTDVLPKKELYDLTPDQWERFFASTNLN